MDTNIYLTDLTRTVVFQLRYYHAFETSEVNWTFDFILWYSLTRAQGLLKQMPEEHAALGISSEMRHSVQVHNTGA